MATHRHTVRLPCARAPTWTTLALFSGVENAGAMRARAAGGEIDAALLDPTHIVSTFHVLCAVNKAVMHREQKNMKTRTIFGEIFYCLSPSTKISESFKKFGIRDDSVNVLAVVVHDSEVDTTVVDALARAVKGEGEPLEKLSELNDVTAIRTLYKVTSEEEEEMGPLENCVVTTMANKDVS